MKKLISLCLVVCLVFFTSVNVLAFLNKVQAAALNTASVLLSDSRPSQSSVTYTLTYSGVTLSPIKCIKVKFSDAATGGSKPSGMNITSAALSGSSNYVPTPGGWSISNNNTTGVSEITYASGETPAAASSRTVILTGISNGSVAETGYFLQFNTYNNIDCTSSAVDSSVADYIYINGVVVSATVDPTLSITVSAVNSGQTVNSATTTITTTATTIPFGTVTAAANAIGAQTVTVTTNGAGGYTLTTKYTGQLSNGISNWTDLTADNASPAVFPGSGNENFGYTTEDFSLQTGTTDRFQSNKWAKFTTSPLEVVYNSGAVASQATKIGFQLGTSVNTPAGTYTTTVVYVLTATY